LWSFYWHRKKLGKVYLKFYFFELEFPSNKPVELFSMLREVWWVFFKKTSFLYHWSSLSTKLLSGLREDWWVLFLQNL
jgi:hypothetical protein